MKRVAKGHICKGLLSSNLKYSLNFLLEYITRFEFLPRLQGSVDPKNDIDSAYTNTFGFVVSNMFYPIQLINFSE